MVKKLGKYELIEIIGRGAMGEVYKARDPLIGRLVALKTITNGLAGHPDLLERFHQEARAAGTLQHPNIVTVYELGQEGETPFIAMEFLEGESIESLIERKPVLSIPEKISYIIPVCRALNFAHKRGVIHRDIKPANVMLTREGRIKVVDFGIARQIDSSVTQTNAIIGTLAYMSPQQIRGERADERSDIWATGVMLYEILTFRRPFDGANQAALVLNITSDTFIPASIRTLLPDCGPALEALVDRMLAKDIQQRYQNMEGVLNAFEPVLRKQQPAGTRTVMAGDDLVRTRMSTSPRTISGSAPTVVQAQVPLQPPPPDSQATSSDGPQSLALQLKSYKAPIAAILCILALIIILGSVLGKRPGAGESSGTAAAHASAVLDAGSVTPKHSEPIAPGVIATVDELSQPWAAKEFVFHTEANGQFLPAMVVHLPRGGYWGFSLIEPYGSCRLQYVTDLQKLANVYDFPADHPLIVDPCNKTLFDLLRYGGPMNAEVRGDIIRGAGVRPPIAIEIQQSGDSIVAVKMEEN